MASLFDNVVSEPKIFKGAARVVYADIMQPFPTKIEDVIDPTTYALAAGWHDLGATTRDGVRVIRGLEKDPGVEVDQVASNILLGAIRRWTGRVSMSLLHTDIDTLILCFETGAKTTTSAGAGVVAQDIIQVGSPPTLTKRRLAVIQKHSVTDFLRMLVFRQASLAAEDIEVPFQSDEVSVLPVTFELEADLTQPDAENLFAVFEQTA